MSFVIFYIQGTVENWQIDREKNKRVITDIALVCIVSRGFVSLLEHRPITWYTHKHLNTNMVKSCFDLRTAVIIIGVLYLGMNAGVIIYALVTHVYYLLLGRKYYR